MDIKAVWGSSSGDSLGNHAFWQPNIITHAATNGLDFWNSPQIWTIKTAETTGVWEIVPPRDKWSQMLRDEAMKDGEQLE